MPAALERSYDGIIIGAGHHGLVLGSYLARCGLDILLVDRRLQYGGALVTEEVTAPGFYHNLHSINHFHISETPWFKDLGLGDRVTYITPRYEFGQPHLDGSALVFGRDLEETLANVARFSKRDAATFRDWNRKAEEITARIFLPERFSEPLPRAEREALLSRSDIGRDFLAATKRQPFDVVQELFENEHVQLLFLFKISLFGTWLVDTMSKTSPMGSVIRAFDLQSGYQLCKGGSANLARGLMETFIAAGGRFAPQVELERIVIEGGKATGIALKDGRTVRARQFVASTLNVHQTFEDYIGRAQLPAAFLKKLDGFEYTKWTIFGLHLALHEPVRLVRLRRAQRARPRAGAAGQAHDLRLARHAAQSRHRFARLRDVQAGVRRADHREMGALRPQHDAKKHHRAACLYCARVHADLPGDAGRRHFHGRIQRRPSDVQPLRLPHADRAALHGGLGHASGRRDLGRRRLHQRRRHRARSRLEAVVEALGRGRGARCRAGGGVKQKENAVRRP